MSGVCKKVNVMMKIKVCGMRNVDNISELLKLTPDYIGFIFYDKSKRFVTDFPQVEISSSIKKTGVFVNETIDEVLRKVLDFQLDAVQLHGDESVDYCKELNSKSPIDIIKAFSVDENFDFRSTQDYESHCDLFLFDTKGKEYGGNGLKYDWSILKKYEGETPFLLSGGINENDVETIRRFQHSRFVGVDLNSGFEDAPSQKNIQKLKEFKEKLMQSKFQVDKNGYYGQFGGAFIPE